MRTMTVQQQIGRLVWDAEDLAEFIRGACRLVGKGVTRASVEAGLSRNTFSSYVKGKRRPSARSAYMLARYFGVPEAQVLRLAGLEVAGVDLFRIDGLSDEMHRLINALNEDELEQWMEFGEMLLLRRQRRLLEESLDEVERKRD